MRFRLFLFILIIILSALAYFGYPIIKNRYFNAGSKTIQNESDQTVDSQIPNQEKSEPEGKFESNFLNITVISSDCDNECSRFEKSDELEYCKEVCGLSALEKKPEESNNCESKSGLQKDFCLKDLGILKKDYNACDQIADEGIKKTCKNRITENIIESQ